MSKTRMQHPKLKNSLKIRKGQCFIAWDLAITSDNIPWYITDSKRDHKNPLLYRRKYQQRREATHRMGENSCKLYLIRDHYIRFFEQF